MVHQAQFRNSIFLLISFLITCCNPTGHPVINGIETALQSINGTMFLNNQPFTGKIYFLYPASTDTAEIVNYLEGKEDGLWKKFYRNGVLKERREFHNGDKEGEYIAWWENGNKKLFYSFNTDEYEGTCREWNSNGILIKEMNYEKGYEAGSQKMFYDSGKTRSNYVIINGRRYGLLGSKNCVNVSDSVFKK